MAVFSLSVCSPNGTVRKMDTVSRTNSTLYVRNHNWRWLLSLSPDQICRSYSSRHSGSRTLALECFHFLILQNCLPLTGYAYCCGCVRCEVFTTRCPVSE